MRKFLALVFTTVLLATTVAAQVSNSTVTVQQPVASKLKMDLSDTGANTIALKVDGSAVTQPVSGTITTVPSGTQTVTGTVTANQGGIWNIQDITGTVSLPTGAATSALQTTGNASLSSIDGKIVTADTGNVTVVSSALPVGASTEATLSALNTKVTAVDTGNVTITSSALPTGASTSALQTTGNASLSSIDGKIVAVDTGAVVVASSALPTGASTEATLSALNAKVVTVDTGNVTVSSSALPTGAATSALQTTGNASLASIDGKIVAVDTGAVTVTSSALPTGAATLAEQQTQTTSLQLLDDTVATVGIVVPTKGIAAIGTDGTDARILKTDLSGELQVDVLSSALPTGAATEATLSTLNGKVTAVDTGNVSVVSVIPGTGATNLGKAEDSVIVSGDTGVGVLFRQIPLDGTAAVLAGVGDYSHAAVDGNGRVVVMGPASHTAPAATAYAPFIGGGGSVADVRTLVTDNQIVLASYDLSGRQITSPYCNSENIVSGTSAADITDTTSTTIISAIASKRVYLNTVCFSNTDTLINTRVDILDGATVKASMFVGAAAAGGESPCMTLPVPLRGSVNTAWNVQAATTSAELRATLVGCSWNE